MAAECTLQACQSYHLGLCITSSMEGSVLCGVVNVWEDACANGRETSAMMLYCESATHTIATLTIINHCFRTQYT